MISKFIVFLLGSFLLLAVQAEFETPGLTSPVEDYAQIVDASTEKELEQAILSFKQSVGPQVQILTIKTLDGESIEGLSMRVFEKWKLGDKENDNGLLLTVALKERKIRIEVGGGLEGLLPDLKSFYIIEKMKPVFKRGDYSGGIRLGTQEIFEALNDPEAYTNKLKRSERLDLLIPILMLLLFLGIAYLHSKYVDSSGKKNYRNGQRGRRGYSGQRGGRGSGDSFSGGGISWGGGGGRASGGGSSGGW